MILTFVYEWKSKVPGERLIGQKVLERTSARFDVVARLLRSLRTLPLLLVPSQPSALHKALLETCPCTPCALFSFVSVRDCFTFN
jgi:hypothetical protein